MEHLPYEEGIKTKLTADFRLLSSHPSSPFSLILIPNFEHMEYNSLFVLVALSLRGEK